MTALGSRYAITDEVVEHLRSWGASEDLVAFADSHVPRFSSRDLVRERKFGFLLGLLFAVAVSVIYAGVS